MDNVCSFTFPSWQPQLPETVAAHYGVRIADLLQAPSLTAALRGLGYPFSVRLLGLEEGGAGVWFAANGQPHAAGQAERETPVFRRDVLLCLDDTPVVWARSVCAPDSLWREILDCGTRPLGERLFDGSLPLTRTPFEFADTQRLAALHDTPGQAFAARRSWFEMSGSRLGLVECFLPALADYCPTLLK